MFIAVLLPLHKCDKKEWLLNFEAAGSFFSLISVTSVQTIESWIPEDIQKYSLKEADKDVLIHNVSPVTMYSFQTTLWCEMFAIFKSKDDQFQTMTWF